MKAERIQDKASIKKKSSLFFLRRALDCGWRSHPGFHLQPIAGQHIEILKGRGWDRLGYSDLFKRDGSVINLTPYNGDDIIQAHEMTWGAAGVNGISRHIVLEGGRTLSGYSGMKARLITGLFK
ncbi:MAG: hypothetical protein ACQERS_02625 [Bacteroidota bacterium]